MEPFQEIHPGCGHSPLRALPTPLRSLPVYHADVLVVGSGVAGLSAALSAAEAGCHVQVLSKDRLRDTNTRQAQGGIAAAVGLDDSSEFHGGDTLQVGCGLSDFEVVRTFVERGPDAISWLQKLGMRFDLQVDGKLSLGQEGGHKMPRILHSDGTATGMELQRVLMIAARLHPKIDLCEHTAAIELLKDPDDAVCGLVALKGEEPNVQAVIFEADSVVLASGGGGQLFRETTNPSQATADGLALGLRAGADLQDLEFVQFHPTILYLAGAARFLISEVTRGAGALL
ncbi:MAG: FAD-dependent oxidoreductase, partial [Planctomycetes bacterium]|nr:FAD-dependent oxidoreductase [Planctomycetota bacterium]